MDKLEIRFLNPNDHQYKAELADMLAQAWPQSYADNAAQEVDECLAEERIALIALEQGRLVGFVGAIPQYGHTGWELHPLLVRQERRGSGIGMRLVNEIEKQVALRGGITLYLGSDDENGATSLSLGDLFDDTYRKIETITNLKAHPYAFYQRLGYKIVGVIPDASGPGKPDIWMAKRIARNN
jgi:aminoglycoside 6'-N-acetyltransferase I